MSIDTKMAWRNVWRNPRRSILTICAVAFASLLLVFMLSWQFGSYETMINSAVKIHSGHLQVKNEQYEKKRSIRLVVPDPGAVSGILDEVEGIEAYTFRANAFSLVSSKDRTYGVVVIGIDPSREAQVSTIAKVVRRGNYLTDGDGDQAILGELLARNLRVDVGDELVLLGQGRDGSVAATVVYVKGIYNSGQDEFDRSSIHIPIRHFQNVYAMGRAVHEVVALGKSLGDVKRIKEDIAGRLDRVDKTKQLVVMDWMDLMPGLIQGIKMDLISGLIFYLILIVVVAFSILNTFLMALLERTREFGVLMAIGTTPGRLTRLLLLESVTMTVVGVALGIIVGSLVTWYFQAHGIVIASASELMRQFGIPERMYPQLSILSVTIGPVAVLIITVLCALYPAIKVRRLKPVEALLAV